MWTDVFNLMFVILRVCLLQVHKGVDKDSVSFTGTECDTLDEIEEVLKRIGSEDMASRGDSKEEAEAERAFDDLYKVKHHVYVSDLNFISTQFRNIACICYKNLS